MAKPHLFGMVEIDIFLLRQNFNWEYRATKDRNLRAIYICINLNICANLSAQMCTQDHNIGVQFRWDMYKYDNNRAQMGKRRIRWPQMSLSCTCMCWTTFGPYGLLGYSCVLWKHLSKPFVRLFQIGFAQIPLAANHIVSRINHLHLLPCLSIILHIYCFFLCTNVQVYCVLHTVTIHIWCKSAVSTNGSSITFDPLGDDDDAVGLRGDNESDRVLALGDQGSVEVTF